MTVSESAAQTARTRLGYSSGGRVQGLDYVGLIALLIPIFLELLRLFGVTDPAKARAMAREMAAPRWYQPLAIIRRARAIGRVRMHLIRSDGGVRVLDLGGGMGDAWATDAVASTIADLGTEDVAVLIREAGVR